MKPFQASVDNPQLRRAALAMNRNDIPQAERLLKAYLHDSPTDVPAIRMLAEVAMRIGNDEDARRLLERALELAPDFTPARFQYAVLLNRLNEHALALAQIDRLLALEPRNPAYRNLAAVVLSRVGEFGRSNLLYAELVAEHPDNPWAWMSYGHVLKTQGRQDEAIAAYRKAIEKKPSFGEPWWSLANLKTFRFSTEELATIQRQLADPTVDEASRVNLHFALGKAYEDAGAYELSFVNYAAANAMYRASHPYEPEVIARRCERLKAVFTRGFFASRDGVGCQLAGPIFIVGMPRAGSTLVEQILSCHPAIEGMNELPELITLARELREIAESNDPGAYADVLASMDAGELQDLGERYLERIRVHRKTERPFFIDKMPNNFLHVAMIQLILPNARIIDARRHPMACCFSNFKQHYARGQRFSYGLSDLGHFYRIYADLMAHFDAVLPGRIHRVLYERTVDETEAEVRRLLDYCDLPFEPACLRFFESERPVRTASSEQVRQPIYRDGIDQWRHFERWLEPLRSALVPALASYPDTRGG
jgi:tetratricopeptide (TPR) repeat protein